MPMPVKSKCAIVVNNMQVNKNVTPNPTHHLRVTRCDNTMLDTLSVIEANVCPGAS